MIKKKLMSVVLANISMLMLVSCGDTTLQKYIQENSADSIKETSAVQSEIKTQQNTESQQSIVQQGKELQQSDVQQQSKELQQSDVQQQSTELQQSTGQQNTELVSDAYCDVIFDDYYSNKLNCYHIPQVSLSNGRAYDINAKMYNELNTILQKNVYYGDMNDKNYYPYITQMSYSWGQDKGIISIIAKTVGANVSITSYYVYNISYETGKELDVSDFCDKYNLSLEDYYNIVRDTMKKYWDLNSNMINMVGQKQYDTLVEDTLNEDNVKAAIPCLNSNGELCIIANIYSAAGAGSYKLILNTSTGQKETFNCSIDHAE